MELIYRVLICFENHLVQASAPEHTDRREQVTEGRTVSLEATTICPGFPTWSPSKKGRARTMVSGSWLLGGWAMPRVAQHLQEPTSDGSADLHFATIVQYPYFIPEGVWEERELREEKNQRRRASVGG